MPKDHKQEVRWRRLAEHVVRRRAELGLTQAEVAEAGQFSVDRLQAIEAAERTSYRPTTLGALARGLQWTADSVDVVLAGGEPTPRPPGELPALTQSASGTVTPPPETPAPVATGSGGRRDLSEYSLAELADEIRRRADEGP